MFNSIHSQSDDNIKIPLKERAILKDIETSNLVELNTWAKSLNLPTGNNAESVRQTLYSHYKVVPDTKVEDPEKKIININRAEISKYYTVEELDESIAEFEGRVEVVIDDKKKEIQHSIIADKLNFNRTLNSVTALGNVEYTKTEKGKPELVVAESLTFKLENWQGSLLKCVSKQDKTIKEEKMVFYYVTGEIKKSDTDVMGMGDVTIQTVPGSPYFNVSALDLWMLDSSDFLIISPSIKIGHVPILWVPFYYHTENSLYFNPVYGYRSREGTVFQNTIYLMGSKPPNEEESDFSFLSFENGEGSGNLELNELTLASSDDKTVYSKDFSKIMIDYYSKLGLYIGNISSLTLSPYITKFELEMGLGFSRTIDGSDGSVFIDNDNSKWNNSYILKSEVPFRYLMFLTVNTPIVNIDFKSLSDQHFKTDFYDRTENFIWVDYLSSQLDDGIEGLSGTDGTDLYARDSDSTLKVDSYSWGIDFATFEPKTDKIKPFVDTFKLDFQRISIDFKNKANTLIIDQNDPASTFFYPDKVKVPTTLNVTGSLFKTESKSEEVVDPEEKKEIYKFDEPLFELENPYLTEEETKETPDEEYRDPLVIDIIKPKEDQVIKKGIENSIFSTNLKYSMTIPVSLNWDMDETQWNEPVDIDYTLKDENLLYHIDPSASLTYNLNLLNSLFAFQDTLKGNIYNKTYAVEKDQKDLVNNYRWNKTLLDNDLLVTINPLALFDTINNQTLSLSYKLNKKLYKKTFDEIEFTNNGSQNPYYKEEFFEWTEDYVTANSLSGKYNYNIGFSDTTVDYDKTLKPLVEKDKIGMSQKFSFWDLTYTTSSSVEYSESFLEDENENDEWKFYPVNNNLSYKPINDISLSSTLIYDIEKEKITDINGTLKLWALTYTVNTTFSKEQNWDTDKTQWVTDTDGDDVLQLNSMVTSLNIVNKKFIFWKNRINFNLTSNLSYTKKFIQVNQSSMKFNLNFKLDVYEFLTLNFASSSENKAMYLYFKEDRELFGIDKEYNFFSDLLRSFNLFNDNDRKDALFNLTSISIDAIYKMPDWNLILSYKGTPKLDKGSYQWYPVYSFFIEWKPLSMVRSKVENKDEEWNVSTSQNKD